MEGENFGKFELVERLGRGGMAEVWKANLPGPGGFQRTMVVKRILPHLAEDENFVKMFMAEARLSARLNQANIVQVYELGSVDGEYYLAMEYIKGRDLATVMRTYVERSELPPVGFAALVLRDVCRALAYAHALADDDGTPLRIIHRDVSPSNVMLAFDGAIKLFDFGIAKALAERDDSHTQTGTLKGKFGYMSPEQVEGMEIDHRADLFAVGIMLHEVLTARRLFKSQSDMQTIALVREAKVVPPSELNAEVVPELDRICLKALSKDRDHRYATCAEMAADLDQVVHDLGWGPEHLVTLLKDLFPDEPSLTGQVQVRRRDYTNGRLRRHEKRQRIAIAAGGALVLALGLTWFIARATRPQPLVTLPTGTTQLHTPIVKQLEAQEVLIQVESVPTADVFLDHANESSGRTPLKLVVGRSSIGHRLELRQKGFHSAETVFIADGDKQLQLNLAPDRPSPTPHPHPRPDPVEHQKPPLRPDPVDINNNPVDPFK